MVRNLQAPEQVVDRLQVADRRFRLLALREHVFGDHLGPGGGDEAADRRRRAHLHHLIGEALAQVLLQDFAALGKLQRLEGTLGRSHLALQLFREMDVDPVQPAAEERRVGRAGAGHLLGDRAREGEKAREPRILDPRVAEAHLADAVEEPPDGMVVRVEDRALREHDAQHRDLHARDQRPEGSGKLRVGEQRLEQTGHELDHLPVDRLARAGEQRRAVLFQAIAAAGRAATRQRRFRGQVAQQLVEPQQRLLELGIASRRAVAAHRPGEAGAAFADAERERAVVAGAARADRGARHARQQRAQRAGTLRLGRREAGERRARRKDHRPVGARLHAGALEPARGRRPRVLQQAGDHAGGRPQDDSALDLRGHDGAGRVPQGRGVDEGAERVRLGADVVVPHQRRGEGLQLAQLPFGGAVDQLHRPGDLDVDVDPRLVHQLEARQAVARLGGVRLAPRFRLFAHTLGERLDEGLLEQSGVAIQRLDDLRVVASFAEAGAARRAEQLRRAGEDPGDERRRAGQFVLDEALIEGRDQRGPRNIRRGDYPAASASPQRAPVAP
jgi:hypothetical protein